LEIQVRARRHEYKQDNPLLPPLTSLPLEMAVATWNSAQKSRFSQAHGRQQAKREAAHLSVGIARPAEYLAPSQGRLWPRDEAEREAIQAAGYDISKILTTDDLAAGEEIFFAATGVSDGDFLQGVRFHAGGAETNSLVMRTRSGTVRKISTAHRWDRAGATNPRASHS